MPFMSPITAVTTNLSVMARFTAILHSTDSVDSIGRDQPPLLAYSFVEKQSSSTDSRQSQLYLLCLSYMHRSKIIQEMGVQLLTRVGLTKFFLFKNHILDTHMSYAIAQEATGHFTTLHLPRDHYGTSLYHNAPKFLDARKLTCNLH